MTDLRFTIVCARPSDATIDDLATDLERWLNTRTGMEGVSVTWTRDYEPGTHSPGVDDAMSSTIDTARIDADEDGLHLIIETVDGDRHDLRVQDTDVARAIVDGLKGWVEEHDHEYAAFHAASPEDRKVVLGRALRDDVDFDALLEQGDLARKAERENRP